MSEYRIHEIQPTLQGEGANTGSAVVLLRFSGCNLECPWCDTVHSGNGINGGVYRSAMELVDAVLSMWPESRVQPRVLCTGGEPLLQLDEELIRAFRNRNARLLLETNGTIPVPGGISWVCVSPKNNDAVVLSGDEVKIVWPAGEVTPEFWVGKAFRHFFLQPLFDENYQRNTRTCVNYCLGHPEWRLSMQTHRFSGIP